MRLRLEYQLSSYAVLAKIGLKGGWAEDRESGNDVEESSKKSSRRGTGSSLVLG